MKKTTAQKAKKIIQLASHNLQRKNHLWFYFSKPPTPLSLLWFSLINIIYSIYIYRPLLNLISPYLHLILLSKLDSNSIFISKEKAKKKQKNHHHGLNKQSMASGSKHRSSGGTKRSRVVQMELCIKVNSTACQDQYQILLSS